MTDIDTTKKQAGAEDDREILAKLEDWYAELGEDEQAQIKANGHRARRGRAAGWRE